MRVLKIHLIVWLCVLGIVACQKRIPEPGQEDLELPSSEPNENAFDQRAIDRMQALGNQSKNDLRQRIEEIKNRDFIRGLNPALSSFENEIEGLNFSSGQKRDLYRSLQSLELKMEALLDNESLSRDARSLLRQGFREFQSELQKLERTYGLDN